MGEQLAQTNQNISGLRIPGTNYEFFNIGNETIRTLINHRIVPARNYEASILRRKPDQLVIDRISHKDVHVNLVVEYKDSPQFKTEAMRLEALDQAATVATALGCNLILATDGIDYIYAKMGTLQDKSMYTKIHHYDGYLFQEAMDFVGNPIEAVKTLHYLMNNVDDKGSIQKPTTINPGELARNIWQINWISKKCTPERALSTFIELFLLKFLSDLGVLVDNNPHELPMSFNAVYHKPPTTCLKYYIMHVRPYIKTIFPMNDDIAIELNGIEQSPYETTTVINGFSLDHNQEEDNQIFHEMLAKFNSYGTLKNIDREFKTRLFEDFLKDTDTIKHRGQFFTPRRIIKAIIEMAQVDVNGEQLA